MEAVIFVGRMSWHAESRSRPRLGILHPYPYNCDGMHERLVRVEMSLVRLSIGLPECDTKGRVQPGAVSFRFITPVSSMRTDSNPFHRSPEDEAVPILADNDSGLR